MDSIKTAPADTPKILVVDDNQDVRALTARRLRASGYIVETAPNGQLGLEMAVGGGYDTIVSDVVMPVMDGIGMLKQLHEKDVNVPVVLVTGEPSLQATMDAVNQRAFRILPKPVDRERLIRSVQEAVDAHRVNQRQRSLLDQENEARRSFTAMETNFVKGLEQLYVVYQPIVQPSDKSTLAFEALVRSNEETMRNPAEFLGAALQLERLKEVGRAVREHCAERLRAGTHRLFVNIHPHELLDEELYSPKAPLSQFSKQVTLEVTEQSQLGGVSALEERVERLRALGYTIALDDIGAGYSSLLSFALLEPDFVKIDMSIVRDVQDSATKQSLIKSILSLCNDLGRKVVAEGVETQVELDKLQEIGCTLFQGYFFARPEKEPPAAKFP